jgi:hypothetical protein
VPLTSVVRVHYSTRDCQDALISCDPDVANHLYGVGVDRDDVVEPGDAAFQTLLAFAAENTGDGEKRDRLIDSILTVQPMAEWPPESLEKLCETARFIISLAADLRRKG